MESVFAVCDVFFVSKLGASAVATVGLTESWLTLVYALAMGLAIAASAMVARRTGERDREGAARAGDAGHPARRSRSSLVLGIVGATFAPQLLRVMGASPDVIATGTTYARVMLGGNVDDRHAVPDQRDLPRRGRRGDRDARALVGERDQHRARAVPDLRARSVPAARRHRRGGRDEHRPRHGRAVRAVSRLLKPGSRIDIHTRHLKLDPALIGEAAAARVVGGAAVADRHGQLDRARCGCCRPSAATCSPATRSAFASSCSRCCRRRASRTPRRRWSVRRSARSKPERAEQAVKIAGTYNMVVLTVVGVVARRSFAPLIARLFTSDPAVGSVRGERAADRCVRVSVLRVGNGDLAVVQRRGRHAHADAAEPVRVLVLGDSARVSCWRSRLDLGPCGSTSRWRSRFRRTRWRVGGRSGEERGRRSRI